MDPVRLVVKHTFLEVECNGRQTVSDRRISDSKIEYGVGWRQSAATMPPPTSLMPSFAAGVEHWQAPGQGSLPPVASQTTGLEEALDSSGSDEETSAAADMVTRLNSNRSMGSRRNSFDPNSMAWGSAASGNADDPRRFSVSSIMTDYGDYSGDAALPRHIPWESPASAAAALSPLLSNTRSPILVHQAADGPDCMGNCYDDFGGSYSTLTSPPGLSDHLGGSFGNQVPAPPLPPYPHQQQLPQPRLGAVGAAAASNAQLYGGGWPPGGYFGRTTWQSGLPAPLPNCNGALASSGCASAGSAVGVFGDTGFYTPSRTTVMLRNLPEGFTRNMLTNMLDDGGFAGVYDFVYMPMNFRTKASFGYAFVNLITSADAERCHDYFQGFRQWGVATDKVCEVSWSDMHQGLQAHIERYRNSPVMHESVPDEYKPAMFAHGSRVPFPPPTKKLRVPRIRRSPDGSVLDDSDLHMLRSWAV